MKTSSGLPDQAVEDLPVGEHVQKQTNEKSFSLK